MRGSRPTAIIRRVVNGSKPFARAWPAIADTVPRARHAVVGFLRDAETSDPPLSDIGLAVSEGLTNVVHHAYADRDAGEFRVAVDVAEEEIEVVIEDDGIGMVPRADTPGLGLGLPLMATLSRHFDARVERGGGTRVFMTFPRTT